MGVGLWVAAALLALVIARIVPHLRGRLLLDAVIAPVAALLLGLAATALDFGGWNAVDWRAGLFVFFGTLAVLGSVRLVN